MTEPSETIHVTWAAEGPEPPLLAPEAVRAAAAAALAHGGRAGAELEVVFVDDERLASMHGEWLGDDSPTDVITFDLGNDTDGPVGELYVSEPCARRVAAEQGIDPARELALYVVHGALHLCGFDDHADDDRARMRAAEREVLAALGYGDDAPAFE